MTAYQFGEKQSDKSPAQSSNTQGSRSIPVHDGTISFDLGVKPAVLSKPQPVQPNQTPLKEVTTPRPQQPSPPTPILVAKTAFSLPHPIAETAKPPLPPLVISIKKYAHNFAKIFTRFWHVLEFISVSAAIFAVFFFFINYQSYSQLLLTKLDLLKNQLNQNPYTEQQAQETKNASPAGQQPLPIVNTAQAAKKQVPALTLEIAPPDERVLIPRIGQNVPIVQIPTDTLIRRDWSALEKQIQQALREGVVHFPGTAFPGAPGNVVITGHSSYFPWDSGRFKDVFALLHQVNLGDQIIVYHDQRKYTYEVYEKKVVKPTEISVLTQGGDTRLTLITCTPVGTDLNRLVVLAKPISIN